MLNKTINLIKIQKHKVSIGFAAILLLVIASMMAALPTVNSQAVNPPLTGYTIAYLNLMPNPAGVNQQVLVNAWVSPPPLLNYSDAAMPGFYAGTTRTSYLFDFTKPDGTVLHFDRSASGEGATWMVFTPDQIGTWSCKFSWPGDANFSACTTTVQLVVQQQRIADYPASPIPSYQWTYPVSPMFKGSDMEWIIGPWLQTQQDLGSGWGYDSAGTNFNPYTQGPQSSHILWRLAPDAGSAGGLVGGQFGTLYNPVAAKSIGVVMSGHAYYNGADGKIHCINDTDGTQLWAVPGRFDLGIEEPGQSFFGMGTATITPYLLEVDSKIVKYSAFTGAVVANVTIGTLTGVGMFGPAYDTTYMGFTYPTSVLVRQVIGAKAYLLKLNVAGVPTSLQQMIAWNVSYPEKGYVPPYGSDIGTVIDDNRGIFVWYQFAQYGNSFGVNLKDGTILWNKPIFLFEQKPQSIIAYNGYFWLAENTNRTYDAFDMATGNVVIRSTQAAAPWGDFWAYGGEAAYGNVYIGTYDGVYAYNANTGVQQWEFTDTNTYTEQPYGRMPFWSFGAVADGTLYIPSGEHSPTTIYNGQKLYAIDAYSGALKWKIQGFYSSVTAVADEKLFASNGIDGYTYCFGKGPSATTVSASQSVLQKGSSILIQGTVTDQSPAQPGTPAISDSSMSAWLEYLHMQQPKPTDATGVTVKLTAVDSNGNTVDIGTVTSNANGMFKKLWTPSAEGEYSIIATFDGSNSYYGSSAETVVGVSSTAATQPGTDMFVIIALVVIIIILVVLAAVILRRLK